jgi:hypothetical protein
MMWQQWLLGDYVQNIPPLKILTSADVAHLDALPLAVGERRRPARKVLADLRFVMTFVETKVREANRWVDDHNARSIAEMFRVVEHHFIISSNRSHDRRNSQIKWQTMVQLLRKKERQNRQQQ